MKLISTDFGEKSIELLYADNPDTDAASKLLVVRLPREIDQAKSLAFHRYWSLRDLRDFIDEQIEHEQKISVSSN
jgi:hypothetical protein